MERMMSVFGSFVLVEGNLKPLVLVPIKGRPFLTFCYEWKDEFGVELFDGQRDYVQSPDHADLHNYWEYEVYSQLYPFRVLGE
jgi:hypothetical protein